MKKASASLVVLSVIFLVTALLIYLFEYVSIERMMYFNRSKMKQYSYNKESLSNIITKDIEATYANGGDINELLGKEYSVFEGQNAKILLNQTIKKDAFKIYYTEVLSNNKEKISRTNYSLLNKIFLKDHITSNEKEKFYDEIKENEVKNFTVEEINNYFNGVNDEPMTFDFGNAMLKITQAADNSIINASILGSGILIIDGDVNIHGNFKFKGLIIIDGKLSIDGDSNINGIIIDIKNKSNIKYYTSLHTMYQNCKNYKGIIKVCRSSY